jgi:hypothetical protein
MSIPNQFDFRPPYSISGEAGKSLGSAVRTLEVAGVTSAYLNLVSMATDTLQLTQQGYAAPDYLEQVSLWDADGVRVFTGTCTAVEESLDAITKSTISGPWWWLEQAQITSMLVDGVGQSRERPVFTFPAQNLATSLAALITRFVAMGIPLQLGTISTTFSVPQMQFQNGTGDSILTTMLQWIPDAATRFRYASGLPFLDIIRRGSAAVVSYNLASGQNLTGSPTLRELRSLVPTQVTVQTMSVNASGNIVYGQEIAGTASPSTPLGRQLLALSGPGKSDFSPYTPRVSTLRTEAPTTPNHARTLSWIFDPVIVQAESLHGAITWSGPLIDTGAYPGLYRSFFGFGAPRVVEGTVTEWMREEFGIIEGETRVAGWLFGEYNQITGFSAATKYLISVGRAFAGYSAGRYNQAIYLDFMIPTINYSYPTLTTFIHPADVALVTPVPSLALNLFNAQNYIPVSGTLPLYPGAALSLPGNRINITGALPKWETMGAMSSRLNIDLETGAGELEMGRSERASSSNLLNQFSRPLSGKIVKV